MDALKPNFNRLRKLALHLVEGKLLHKGGFNFSQWNGTDGHTTDAHPCGTTGCAIGEAPAAFPRYWTFKQNYYDSDAHLPCLRTSKKKDVSSSGVLVDAAKFFNISKEDASALFIPHPCNIFHPHPWNTFMLKGDASQYDVAAGILNYIAYYQTSQKVLREKAKRDAEATCSNA